MEQAQNPVFDQIQYFYVKCYFTVGVIALRHLPTLLNVDVDVDVDGLFVLTSQCGNNNELALQHG